MSDDARVKRAVLSLALLAACSPRPGNPEVAGPAPSASAGVLDKTGPTAPDDPRIVRCGVDDAPHSVISGMVEGGDSRFAKRAPLLADRAAPPPLTAGPRSRPAPVPPFSPPPPPPTRPPPPPPPPEVFRQTHLVVGVAHDMSGGPVEPAMIAAGRALEPRFKTCVPQAGEADLGEQSIEVTLSGAGSPLWVLPTTPSQPTIYGRCLLEQACSLAAPGSGATRKVFLPLQTSKDPPPPPPTPRPQVNVSVVMDATSAGLADVGRSVLDSAGRACASQVRLTRDARFRVTISTARGAEIATSSVDGSTPAMDALISCAVAQIQARIPPRTKAGSFSGIIRWEP